MTEFILMFGEEMEPGKEYEKYLKLLGLSKKRARAQSCEDGHNCPEDSEVVGDIKKDSIDNNRGEWNKRTEYEKEDN